MLTARVFRRRHSVLKSGPIRRNRLSTNPVVCQRAIPNSTFMVWHVWVAASLRECYRPRLPPGAASRGDVNQTLVDNVNLLTPKLLGEVNQLIVESGHTVMGKKPGEPLCGCCDSFVVETNVHYPTDVNLSWDAMRCMLRYAGPLGSKHKGITCESAQVEGRAWQMPSGEWKCVDLSAK